MKRTPQILAAEVYGRMEKKMKGRNGSEGAAACENPITEGSIPVQLMLFFFPILIGSLFQQLYNMVDAVIVGRYLGKAALEIGRAHV